MLWPQVGSRVQPDDKILRLGSVMRTPSRHWRAEENGVERKLASRVSRWSDVVSAAMIIMSLAGLIYEDLGLREPSQIAGKIKPAMLKG